MRRNSDYSDDALQQLASQGDEQAFKELFDRHHARLFQYLFNIVKSKEVAEELVMDVFLNLWLARDMMHEIRNLDGFLFRAAYNKSIDFFRSAANNKNLTDIIWERIQIPAQSYADAPLIMQEYEARLREAIDLLPPQRRRIFLLHKEEGLSYQEIAEKIGISKYTAANTLTEARQFIKSYLTQHLDLLVFMAVLSNFLKNK